MEEGELQVQERGLVGLVEGVVEGRLEQAGVAVGQPGQVGELAEAVEELELELAALEGKL